MGNPIISGGTNFFCNVDNGLREKGLILERFGLSGGDKFRVGLLLLSKLSNFSFFLTLKCDDNSSSFDEGVFFGVFGDDCVNIVYLSFDVCFSLNRS